MEKAQLPHGTARRKKNNRKGNGFQHTPASRAAMLSLAKRLCLARLSPRLTFLASPRSAPFGSEAQGNLERCLRALHLPGAASSAVRPDPALPPLFPDALATACLSLLPSARVLAPQGPLPRKGAPTLAGSSFTLSRGHKSGKRHFLQHWNSRLLCLS